MLNRTFCHIPGIGPTFEQRLWAMGVRDWRAAAAAELPGKRGQTLRSNAQESAAALDRGDARYFAERLPTREQWRLFSHFRDRVAYLDIETTGLGDYHDYVTAIAIYDGRRVRHYVHGQNMAQFESDVAEYDLIVTYNGKSFDVPFIRKFLQVHVDQAHIDLMHVLRSLGYTGGLKAIERRFGFDRPDMADVDGFFAVVLWHEYERTHDPDVLETLLAYNVQDVLTLEPLMVYAFNCKVADTPFAEQLQLPTPPLAANPFRAHRDVIDRLKGGRMWP